MGAPRGVVGQGRPKKWPGVGEQRLAGAVGFVGQQPHQSVLGRSSVGTPTADDDQVLTWSQFSPVLMMSLLLSQERQMPPGISQCHHLRNDHSHHVCVLWKAFPSPYAFYIKIRLFLYIYTVCFFFTFYFKVNINGHTSYHDGKYYESCSNCLLSEDTTLLPDGKSKGRYLFLYSEAPCLYSAIRSCTFCSGCLSF